MELEQEILQIKQRNQRVALDKAWEQSWARRIFIAVFTYIVALIWLWLINDSVPVFKAFVPAIGYLLSTLSMSWFKERWQKVFLDKT